MNARFAMIAALVGPLVLTACASSPVASVPATTSDRLAPSAMPAAAGTGTPLVPTNSPSSAPAAGRTQINETGQVTVSATWGGPTAGAVFEMALDTHSVDLDALDLTDAVLRNDRGEALAAQPWAAPAGGHHRSGILTFAGDPSSFFAGAQWIELTLFNIGEVPEQTLHWEPSR